MSTFKVHLRKELNKLTIERFPSLYRPDSLPFISGDTFRKFSNHVFDETQTFNPKIVKKNDIIFINSDLIKIFFKIQDPKIQNKYILISHNSDNSPSIEELKLISNNVLHWFAQNLEFNFEERITLLPIGLENKRWLRNVNFKKQTMNISLKTNLILCSFSVHNNFKIRNAVLNLANSNANIEIKKFDNNKQYFKDLKNYKFILCPPGSGPDTHRVWESLIYRTFPIFETNNFTKNLKKLGVPGIYLKSWNEINKFSEKDLDNEYKNLSSINLDILYFKFWKEQFMKKFII